MKRLLSSKIVWLAAFASLTGCAGKPWLAWNVPATNSSNDAKMAYARLSERHGQEDQATAIYRSIKKDEASQQLAYHRLAVLAAKRGDYSEAEDQFRKATTIWKPSAELLNDLGYLFYLEEKYDEAETTLRSALATNSQLASARTNLGLVLGHQQKYQESFEAFRKAGKEADAYCNLGYVYAHNSQFDLAQACFSRALDIDHDLKQAAEGLIQMTAMVNGRRVPPLPDRRNPSPMMARNTPPTPLTGDRAESRKEATPSAASEDAAATVSHNEALTNSIANRPLDPSQPYSWVPPALRSETSATTPDTKPTVEGLVAEIQSLDAPKGKPTIDETATYRPRPRVKNNVSAAKEPTHRGKPANELKTNEKPTTTEAEIAQLEQAEDESSTAQETSHDTAKPAIAGQPAVAEEGEAPVVVATSARRRKQTPATSTPADNPTEETEAQATAAAPKPQGMTTAFGKSLVRAASRVTANNDTTDVTTADTGNTDTNNLAMQSASGDAIVGPTDTAATDLAATTNKADATPLDPTLPVVIPPAIAVTHIPMSKTEGPTGVSTQPGTTSASGKPTTTTAELPKVVAGVPGVKPGATAAPSNTVARAANPAPAASSPFPKVGGLTSIFSKGLAKIANPRNQGKPASAEGNQRATAQQTAGGLPKVIPPPTNAVAVSVATANEGSAAVQPKMIDMPTTDTNLPNVAVSSDVLAPLANDGTSTTMQTASPAIATTGDSAPILTVLKIFKHAPFSDTMQVEVEGQPTTEPATQAVTASDSTHSGISARAQQTTVEDLSVSRSQTMETKNSNKPLTWNRPALAAAGPQLGNPQQGAQPESRGTQTAPVSRPQAGALPTQPTAPARPKTTAERLASLANRQLNRENPQPATGDNGLAKKPTNLSGSEPVASTSALPDLVNSAPQPTFVATGVTLEGQLPVKQIDRTRWQPPRESGAIKPQLQATIANALGVIRQEKTPATTSVDMTSDGQLTPATEGSIDNSSSVDSAPSNTPRPALVANQEVQASANLPAQGDARNVQQAFAPADNAAQPNASATNGQQPAATTPLMATENPSLEPTGGVEAPALPNQQPTSSLGAPILDFSQIKTADSTANDSTAVIDSYTQQRYGVAGPANATTTTAAQQVQTSQPAVTTPPTATQQPITPEPAAATPTSSTRTPCLPDIFRRRQAALAPAETASAPTASTATSSEPAENSALRMPCTPKIFRQPTTK